MIVMVITSCLLFVFRIFVVVTPTITSMRNSSSTNSMTFTNLKLQVIFINDSYTFVVEIVRMFSFLIFVLFQMIF